MTVRKFGFVVAEDEERTREYLGRKIAEIDPGLECVGLAADGEEAVRLIEENLPEVLVTDIKMPVLSGLDLIAQAKRTNPDLYVVVVSGYNEFEYAQKAIELGVEYYALKPIDLSLLRETLRKLRIKLEASAGDIDAEFGLDRIGSAETELADAIQLYLRENYRNPFSLDRLSSAFGRKSTYLLRLYKRTKGCTPTQEIIKLRIEKAKRLLVGHPQMGVKQIATAVGYEDQLYFSRLFKREAGMNPSAFRESKQRP